MNDPLAMLQQIRDQTDAPATPEAVEWFRQGVKEFLAGGRLDEALELLNGRIRYRLLQKRNKHLLLAWQAIPGDLLPWPRSAKLAQAIRDFLSRTWPRVKSLDAPRANFNAVQIELWHAASTGQKIPGSTMQVHRIINNI